MLYGYGVAAKQWCPSLSDVFIELLRPITRVCARPSVSPLDASSLHFMRNDCVDDVFSSVKPFPLSEMTV